MITSRCRLKAALAGKIEDRPPVGFWAHNFLKENSPEELAQETVRVVRHYGWDMAKIQNRATSFVEDWGLKYRRSAERHVFPKVVDVPIRDASDLYKIKPLDPHKGVLGQQLSALKMIREALGAEFPVIQTVFSPSMALSFLMEEDMGKHGPCLREAVENHPQAVRHAFSSLKETYVNFTAAAFGSGADGVFYSIKPAGNAFLTLEQYKSFCLADDAEVLGAAGGGWFNILHLCGQGVYFEVIPELPCHVVNYEISPRHPRLCEVRDRFKKTVIGGVSPKPYTASLSPKEVADEVTAALDDTSGLGLMVGPGCSISPDTPEANLFAVNDAIRDWTARVKR